MSRELQQLDNLLNALETILLGCSDKALLSSGSDSSQEAEEVRAIVKNALARHASKYRKARKPITVPPDMTGRLRVLRQLMDRPELGTRIGSVLSANALSDRDVNDLTDELVRLGVLRRSKKR